jgi:anaphase-promoting complex subunit 1
MQLISPTLFPDINKLLSICVDTLCYFPFYLDMANNPRHQEVLLQNQTLWVKRWTGHLGHGEDSHGNRSIYIRLGASSGDAGILDNPKPSDTKSASATEFYQFISSFSNEAFYVAFVDQFCRSDGEEENELILSAFSHAAMLECLTLDRPHLIPTYLNIHLTRMARPKDTPQQAIALRNLTWLDEFYKTIYDSRFSGKGDNAPMPPLMWRPLLLAAECNSDAHLPQLCADPQVQAALRAYHCGEGVAFGAPMSSAERDARMRVVRQVVFYLMRTNMPPGGVLAHLREEVQATHGEILEAMAKSKGGKEGVSAQHCRQRKIFWLRKS